MFFVVPRTLTNVAGIKHRKWLNFRTQLLTLRLQNPVCCSQCNVQAYLSTSGATRNGVVGQKGRPIVDKSRSRLKTFCTSECQRAHTSTETEGGLRFLQYNIGGGFRGAGGGGVWIHLNAQSPFWQSRTLLLCWSKCGQIGP